MIVNAKDLSIHDSVVVETDFGGVATSLTAFVTNVLADELWLATRMHDPRVERMQRGQTIHLTFDRDGALVLDSTFLRRLGEGSRFETQKSRVFAVQRPAGVESSQRRAHVRADLDRAVRIRSMGSLGEQIGTGRTLNIGAGGLLFTTGMPVLFGEELRLAIVLTSRDIIIVGGSVVRIEDADPDLAADATGRGPAAMAGTAEGRSRMSKVAVRFDTITEADQERITCHILQVHRQRRASGFLPTLEDTSRGSAASVGGGDTTNAEAPAG